MLLGGFFKWAWGQLRLTFTSGWVGLAFQVGAALIISDWARKHLRF